jgi:hypothetical protein
MKNNACLSEKWIDAKAAKPLNKDHNFISLNDPVPMSDESPTNKTSSIPPPGQGKTSAVPLKKETVRITLRARPGAGVTQPREATSPVSPASPAVPRKTTAQVTLPSAPLPPASAKAPTNPVKLPPAPIPPPGRKTMSVAPAAVVAAPGVPAPSLPAPVAAPRPPAPGAPRPPAPGAPRPAAPGAPAPKMETGAVTQPLTAAPRPPMAGPRPPAAGATAPMAAGAPTAALPKATQKLGAAPAPMARPGISAPQSAPVKRSAMADSQEFYEEKDPDAGLMPLSIFCFLFAAVLLAAQILSTDKLTFSPEGEDSQIMVPAASPAKWEDRNQETGKYTSKWTSALPSIPE